MADMFYVCDLRSQWLHKPYISFWRPNDAGYTYPLPWSGQYEIERLASQPDYYWQSNTRSLLRFPILCRVVDLFGAKPAPKTIDGDVGPVVWNTKQMRETLRVAAMARPTPAVTPGQDGTP